VSRSRVAYVFLILIPPPGKGNCCRMSISGTPEARPMALLQSIKLISRFYPSTTASTSIVYELTFNDYNRVIQATDDPNASYTIDSINMEYGIVTQPELAYTICRQYSRQLAILYNWLLWHRKISRDKRYILWKMTWTCPPAAWRAFWCFVMWPPVI